jgi:hypothetical protein
MEERTMSDDERNRKRKEHEDDEPDFEAHGVPDDTSELDPERKRKRKLYEDSEGDELGRKRK